MHKARMEIDMVNSYNWHKVESLKAERYTLQSSNPKHPSKYGVNNHHNFSQNIYAYGKSFIFVSWWYFITINSSTNKNTFFKSYLKVADCTGHVEGSWMGSDIWIASANCNQHNLFNFITINSSINKNTFFKSYLKVADCTGHVEGSWMGSDIWIASANCNQQNCKSKCIYVVDKFPN